MTGTEILMGLIAIIAILQTRETTERSKRADVTAALRALNEAVIRTSQHIAKGGHRESNYDLTNLWHQASLAFRDVGNTELQRLCSIKGNYWTDPGNWKPEEVQDAGIQLAALQRRLSQLLETPAGGASRA